MQFDNAGVVPGLFFAQFRGHIHVHVWGYESRVGRWLEEETKLQGYRIYANAAVDKKISSKFTFVGLDP